ncbi:putative PurR-regulated permease PerM [Breznakia blatticola]|uniref:Putative PurR-regulated permease PerM n=1 Tax=Breznakia blatticola TaxID=1754012 RepID=A0A4R7ZID2_9FIRM|nr:AI-2E family transporter [Breznakia blatticola]TDW16118.1 putative PurR-regulated permease PerM [Breznakia blatticola]
MKQYFKENKNTLFVAVVIIVLLAIVLRMNEIVSFVLTMLEVFNPFFIAIGIAFILNIPMKAIENGLSKISRNNKIVKKFLRPLSIILTLLFAVVILWLLMIIILPRVAESVVYVFNNFSTIVNNSIKSVDDILNDLHLGYKLQDIPYIKEIQNISKDQELFKHVITFFGSITQGVVKNAVEFTNTFFSYFLAFCLSIYLLAGKETLIYQTKKVIVALFPKNISTFVFETGSKANVIFKNFVGGQLVDCIIKGVMFYIVFQFLDYRFTELMATIIAVCSIVPVFGPIFAMLICFVLIFSYNPINALWFIIIFQVLSNFEGQVIYPKIVGKTIGLPGIWVLLSIFILGGKFGIAGMLLAVPITALAYELFVEYINSRLKKKKINYDLVEEKGED